MSASDHADLFVTALNDVLPEGRKAYRPDGLAVLSSKPATYVEVTVERRYLPDPRMSPGSLLRGWRVTATWVADTVRNADQLEAIASEVLEGLVLDLTDHAATPLVHELSEGTQQDDDSTWTGYVEFTYTAAPT